MGVANKDLLSSFMQDGKGKECHPRPGDPKAKGPSGLSFHDVGLLTAAYCHYLPRWAGEIL